MTEAGSGSPALQLRVAPRSRVQAATNKICDDLGQALKPRSLTIIANWKARGGFSSRITAEWMKSKRKK